ncbi:MAG: hypothetical protein DSY47_07980, partial [Hydrogenothermus sp.]
PQAQQTGEILKETEDGKLAVYWDGETRLPLANVDCSTVETAFNQDIPDLTTQTPPLQEKVEEAKQYEENLIDMLKELFSFKIKTNIPVQVNASKPVVVNYTPVGGSSGDSGGIPE